MKTGYVYKLFSPSTDKVYIGSTALNVLDRMIRHKASFRRYNRQRGRYSSAYELMMYPDVDCVIIEIVHFNDKGFLRERESYHILNTNCVNRRNAKFDYDAYYLTNKDRIKEYYQANKEQKKLYQRLRYNKLKKLKPKIINIELIKDF
jgi:hypothetical protein